MKETLLDQQKVKQILDYEISTGYFYWKERTALCIQEGMQAGSYTTAGYIQIAINRYVYRAHRLAWLYVYGQWPKGILDHINRKKDDNRVENLRLVSITDNLKNQGISKNNTSGVKGVCRNKYGSWVASIYLDKKQVHLGSFLCREQAIEARQKAEIKYGYTGATK
jgi:hypothetical protein